MEQPAKQRRGDPVRRTGDDVEWSARETEIGGVGLHDDDVFAEAPTQVGGACGVTLYRNHVRARGEERPGYCS